MDWSSSPGCPLPLHLESLASTWRCWRRGRSHNFEQHNMAYHFLFAVQVLLCSRACWSTSLRGQETISCGTSAMRPCPLQMLANLSCVPDSTALLAASSGLRVPTEHLTAAQRAPQRAYAWYLHASLCPHRRSASNTALSLRSSGFPVACPRTGRRLRRPLASKQHDRLG